MTVGGFGGWIALYFLLYVFIFPLLNLLAAPIILLTVYMHFFSVINWRKYLIVNGCMSAFGFFAIFMVFSEIVKYDHPLRGHIFSLVVVIGITFQIIFFITWSIFQLRKIKLADSFYSVWGWSFMLLYIFPFLCDRLIAE